MNTAEAKQLMLKYLMPKIESRGFKTPGKSSEFQIKRKTKNGEDVISGGFTDFNPVQKIVYGAGKRDKRIIDILLQIQEKGITLSPPINKNSSTLGISYERIHKLNYIGYLPEMETEADVEKCVNMMLEFLEGTAFPMLDKFEDLREIDRIINGDEPWDTDWEKSFLLGAYFNFSRLVIARLSGNEKYEDLIEFTYSTLERRSKESGHPFTYDREDMNKPLPALIKVLEDIKPQY